MSRLVEVQYERNDLDFHRGTFRVRGDIVEIFPAYAETRAIRVAFFGDTIDSITEIDALTGKPLRQVGHVHIYPNSHYVTSRENLQRAAAGIREELTERIAFFERNHRLLEAQRIRERTLFAFLETDPPTFYEGGRSRDELLADLGAGWAILERFPADTLYWRPEDVRCTHPTLYSELS